MKKLKHLFCIVLAAVVTVTSLAITPMETKADDDTIISVPITVQEEYDLAEDFYELLNQKRADAGKYKYILDDRLMDLAMERATQNCVYYSHKSMTYNTREYAALEGTYVDENINLVKRCNILFFTGGDQLRITSILGGTPINEAIKNLCKSKASIVGTSAGASVMSDTMIIEGKDDESPRKCT